MQHGSDGPPGEGDGVQNEADKAIASLRNANYPDEWHAAVLVAEVERLRAQAKAEIKLLELLREEAVRRADAIESRADAVRQAWARNAGRDDFPPLPGDLFDAIEAL